MLAFGRHDTVHRREHRELDDRIFGRTAVLRVIVRTLDEVLIGTQMYGSVVLRTGLVAGKRSEAGQTLQCNVDLCGRTFVADTVDRVQETLRQRSAFAV